MKKLLLGLLMATACSAHGDGDHDHAHFVPVSAGATAATTATTAPGPIRAAAKAPTLIERIKNIEAVMVALMNKSARLEQELRELKKQLGLIE
ncbi:MAG: hypothetical protein ACYTG5_23420 [Planctomycetota bacterium]|jgi:hypothetical protein